MFKSKQNGKPLSQVSNLELKVASAPLHRDYNFGLAQMKNLMYLK